MSAQAAISALCSALTPELLDLVCDAFAAVTVVNPGEQNMVDLSKAALFDAHFARRSGTMYKWIKQCLEWEYESFLSELRMGENAEPQT